MTGEETTIVDRAAMLQQFATWSRSQQLGFMVATVNVFAADADNVRALEMFAGRMAQEDRPRRIRKPRRGNAA